MSKGSRETRRYGQPASAGAAPLARRLAGAPFEAALKAADVGVAQVLGDLALGAVAVAQMLLGALQAHVVEDALPAGALGGQPAVQGAGIQAQGTGHLVAVRQAPTAQSLLQALAHALAQAGGDAQGFQLARGVGLQGGKQRGIGLAQG